MEKSEATSPRRSGRPRDQSMDAAIIEAASELIASGGYASLTLEAVARRANVSRPAIYRRYANKAEIIIDMVSRFASVEGTHEGIAPVVHNRGTLEDDLEDLLDALTATFDSLEARGIAPGILAELIAHPDLAQRFYESYLYQAEATVREAFARAAARGEIESSDMASTAMSMLVGAYLYHRYITAQPVESTEKIFITRTIAKGLRR